MMIITPASRSVLIQVACVLAVVLFTAQANATSNSTEVPPLVPENLNATMGLGFTTIFSIENGTNHANHTLASIGGKQVYRLANYTDRKQTMFAYFDNLDADENKQYEEAMLTSAGLLVGDSNNNLDRHTVLTESRDVFFGGRDFYVAINTTIRPTATDHVYPLLSVGHYGTVPDGSTSSRDEIIDWALVIVGDDPDCGEWEISSTADCNYVRNICPPHSFCFVMNRDADNSKAAGVVYSSNQTIPTDGQFHVYAVQKNGSRVMLSIDGNVTNTMTWNSSFDSTNFMSSVMDPFPRTLVITGHPLKGSAPSLSYSWLVSGIAIYTTEDTGYLIFWILVAGIPGAYILLNVIGYILLVSTTGAKKRKRVAESVREKINLEKEELNEKVNGKDELITYSVGDPDHYLEMVNKYRRTLFCLGAWLPVIGWMFAWTDCWCGIDKWAAKRVATCKILVYPKKLVLHYAKGVMKGGLSCCRSWARIDDGVTIVSLEYSDMNDVRALNPQDPIKKYRMVGRNILDSEFSMDSVEDYEVLYSKKASVLVNIPSKSVIKEEQGSIKDIPFMEWGGGKNKICRLTLPFVEKYPLSEIKKKVQALKDKAVQEEKAKEEKEKRKKKDKKQKKKDKKQRKKDKKRAETVAFQEPVRANSMVIAGSSHPVDLNRRATVGASLLQGGVSTPPVYLSWTLDDIKEWLIKIELQDLVSIFEENKINGKALPLLTDEDMKEMGITVLGHRRLIQAELKHMDEDAAKAPVEEPVSPRVSTPELNEIVENAMKDDLLEQAKSDTQDIVEGITAIQPKEKKDGISIAGRTLKGLLLDDEDDEGVDSGSDSDSDSDDSDSDDEDKDKKKGKSKLAALAKQYGLSEEVVNIMAKPTFKDSMEKMATFTNYVLGAFIFGAIIGMITSLFPAVFFLSYAVTGVNALLALYTFLSNPDEKKVMNEIKAKINNKRGAKVGDQVESKGIELTEML